MARLWMRSYRRYFKLPARSHEESKTMFFKARVSFAKEGRIQGSERMEGILKNLMHLRRRLLINLTMRGDAHDFGSRPRPKR